MSRPIAMAALMISRHVVVGAYQPSAFGNPSVALHALCSAVRHCFLGLAAGPLRNSTGMSKLSA